MAAPPPEHAAKTLTAACHCKSVRFTISVPADALPLKVHLCHCSVCRHSTGMLCLFHAPLPAGVAPQFIAPSSPQNLTQYVLPGLLSLRHFCSTCGCHIGDRSRDANNWVLSSAIFDANREEVGIWKINKHIYTASAPGGLHEWLPRIGDQQIEIASDEIETNLVEDSVKIMEHEAARTLTAKCHCGGVSLSIKHPTKEMLEDTEIQEWVSPLDSTKWVAVLDVCDDCRLVNGTNVVGWAFIPKIAISPAVPTSLLVGTSKFYASSKNVQRTFCGTCGATVFYSCDERPNIPDVAVGILRASEGVSAENWLTWRTKRLSSVEDGYRYDEAFATAMTTGLCDWGKANPGKVLG